MARGAGALARIVQQDFSGGMFPALAPELIPVNGAFDITNGLLDEQNVCYRRGGSSYASLAPAGSGVRMLWSGFLKHGGQQTILCVADGSFRMLQDGTLEKIALVPPTALVTPTVFQGVLYFEHSSWDGETAGFAGAGPQQFLATAANRVLTSAGGRINVSSVPKAEGEAYSFPSTNYFSLPEGVAITGMVGWRTSCVVFTTMGIWMLGGLNLEQVDESGNVQWSQDRYSADAVLWGQPGVAAWKGGLVIPCKDDVWLMELGVSSEKSTPFRSISGPIQNVYRAYVAAGYTPGAATVFNGHYFLPILNGEAVVDLLVCRLEGLNNEGKAEPAWTHLKGYGARIAALVPTVSDVEGPLIGATAGLSRLLRLAYFAPSPAAATDADSSSVAFEVTTRSIPTGNLVPNTVLKARLSYRLVANAGTEFELLFGESPYGSEWGNFNWGEGVWTAATGEFVSLGEAIPPAGPDPQGLTPKTWRVTRKVRYARVKMVLNGPASEASIRALELAVRPSGRVF